MKSPKTYLGRHFQAGSRATRDPGLKPWAVLYIRFAANPRCRAINCLATMILSLWDYPTTRLPSRPESGSGAAQARRRSGPVPDRESTPTNGPNPILEQLCWVPTETCSSRIGPDRSRSSRPALRWKTRMPLHTLRRPVIRFGSLRRTQDTDRLWVQASLSVTLTQSSAGNSESISI